MDQAYKAFRFAAAFSDTVSGTVKETEWGMVGLGVILGAGFALVMGFLCHLLSEYWHRGMHTTTHTYYTTVAWRHPHSLLTIKFVPFQVKAVPLVSGDYIRSVHS